MLEGLNTSGIDPNVLSAFDWGNDEDKDGFFAANGSFPILTYQENLLIQAEANLKKATPDPLKALAALNTFRAYLADENKTYIKTGYHALGLMYDAYTLLDFAPGGIANRGTLSANQALLLEILQDLQLL